MPNKVSEALTHPDWRSTMIEEMDAFTDNGIWDLVSLPVKKKVIGCRWVFTVKVNLDGSIARLCRQQDKRIGGMNSLYLFIDPL